MMKKILAGLVLGVLLLSFAASVSAQATVPEMPSTCQVRADVDARLGTTGCVVGSCTYSGASNCSICCLLGTILYITDWVFVFLIALVMTFVLIGAYNILTAAGDTTKVTAGKNYILYAAIGFALALLARAIPAVVKFLVIGTA